jgi:hypothetical protein
MNKTAPIPKKSFYAGNGKLISREALQDLAEHLTNGRCMDYLREAFVEILNGLDMPDDDKNYYKWACGFKEE